MRNGFFTADELVEGTNYEVYDRNFELKGTVRFAGIDSHGDFIFFKQIYSNICDAWILTPADWTMTEEYASNLYFKAVMAKDRNAETIENRYFCKEISKVLRVDVDHIVSFTTPEFMVKDGVKCYCVQYTTRFGDKYFAIFRGPALELIYKAPVEHLGKTYHDLAVCVSDVCDKELSQSKAAKMLGCSQPYICMKHKEFCNILSENGFVDADKLVEGKKYDIYDRDFEKKITVTFVGRNENGEFRFLRERLSGRIGEWVRGEKSVSKEYFKEV